MEKLESKKELFSYKDLCDLTGGSYRTFHRAGKEGKIKTVRLGGRVLVPKSEVERIISKGF